LRFPPDDHIDAHGLSRRNMSWSSPPGGSSIRYTEHA
jgi:hypothetical protein